MTKLHDLISFKHSLEKNLDTTDLRSALDALARQINSVKIQAHLEPKNVEFINSLVEHYQNLLTQKIYHMVLL